MSQYKVTNPLIGRNFNQFTRGDGTVRQLIPRKYLKDKKEDYRCNIILPPRVSAFISRKIEDAQNELNRARQDIREQLEQNLAFAPYDQVVYWSPQAQKYILGGELSTVHVDDNLNVSMEFLDENHKSRGAVKFNNMCVDNDLVAESTDNLYDRFLKKIR